MPGLFHEPLSRKGFLTAVAGAGLSALPGSLARAQAADAVNIALLSDTHIPADAANEFRGFRPVANLKQIVPEVAASQPDVAIINGDAARLTGEKDDYLALKGLLAPIATQTPIYIGLGNHDDRANFFDVFTRDGTAPKLVKGKHVAVIERPGVRILVLDSLLYVDRVAGLLGKSQRDWLAQFLASSDDRPHVLFVHHTLGDGDGDLLDVDRLFHILEPHRKVKAIFFGHSHVYSFDRRRHIHLVNLPAVGYNFADNQPVGWVQARFAAAGVALTLHAVGGMRDEDGVTTSIAW
jgi:Icc protein